MSNVDFTPDIDEAIKKQAACEKAFEQNDPSGWRVLAISAAVGGAAYAVRKKARPRQSAALTGAVAFGLGFGLLNMAAKLARKNIKAECPDANLGNVWEMPRTINPRADRYQPPPGMPWSYPRWRMPGSVARPYYLPPNGNPSRNPDFYMPPSFQPAPIPTPLRTTWADVIAGGFA